MKLSEFIEEKQWTDNAKDRAAMDIESAMEVMPGLMEDMLCEKDSSFEVLKNNKIKLTDEERKKAMKAGCVWHWNSSWNGPLICAIWKAKDSQGKIWFGSNTHRVYKKAKTLKGAIKDFKFIKGTV